MTPKSSMVVSNGILFRHNHPSGIPSLSDHGFRVMERQKQTAEVIGFPIIDHINRVCEKAIRLQKFHSGNQS
jgi:DNA repair protein RadC